MRDMTGLLVGTHSVCEAPNPDAIEVFRRAESRPGVNDPADCARLRLVVDILVARLRGLNKDGADNQLVHDASSWVGASKVEALTVK